MIDEASKEPFSQNIAVSVVVWIFWCRFVPRASCDWNNGPPVRLLQKKFRD